MERIQDYLGTGNYDIKSPRKKIHLFLSCKGISVTINCNETKLVESVVYSTSNMIRFEKPTPSPYSVLYMNKACLKDRKSNIVWGEG